MYIRTLIVHKATELPPSLFRVSADDPASDAKAIWQYVFAGEPWPIGTTVRWQCLRSEFTLGFCRPRVREIVLNSAKLKSDTAAALDVLVHELVHLRGPLRHNQKFYLILNEARAALGLTPVVWPSKLWRNVFREPREAWPRRCPATLPLWQEARP